MTNIDSVTHPFITAISDILNKGVQISGDWAGRAIHVVQNLSQHMQQNRHVATAVFVTANTAFFTLANIGANWLNHHMTKREAQELNAYQKGFKVVILDGVVVGGLVLAGNVILSKLANYPLSNAALAAMTVAAMALRFFFFHKKEGLSEKKAAPQVVTNQDQENVEEQRAKKTDETEKTTDQAQERLKDVGKDTDQFLNEIEKPAKDEQEVRANAEKTKAEEQKAKEDGEKKAETEQKACEDLEQNENKAQNTGLDYDQIIKETEENLLQLRKKKVEIDQIIKKQKGLELDTAHLIRPRKETGASQKSLKKIEAGTTQAQVKTEAEKQGSLKLEQKKAPAETTQAQVETESEKQGSLKVEQKKAQVETTQAQVETEAEKQGSLKLEQKKALAETTQAQVENQEIKTEIDEAKVEAEAKKHLRLMAEQEAMIKKEKQENIDAQAKNAENAHVKAEQEKKDSQETDKSQLKTGKANATPPPVDPTKNVVGTGQAQGKVNGVNEEKKPFSNPKQSSFQKNQIATPERPQYKNFLLRSKEIYLKDLKNLLKTPNLAKMPHETSTLGAIIEMIRQSHPENKDLQKKDGSVEQQLKAVIATLEALSDPKV